MTQSRSIRDFIRPQETKRAENGEDPESFADGWTEQEIYDALQRILKREWDRFKFLGWL